MFASLSTIRNKRSSRTAASPWSGNTARALQSVCEMLIQVDLTNDLVLSEYVRWGASSRFPRGENYSQCCVEFMQECVHPDDRGTFSAAFCRKNLHLQNMDEDAPVTYLEYRIKEPSDNYHWGRGHAGPARRRSHAHDHRDLLRGGHRRTQTPRRRRHRQIPP